MRKKSSIYRLKNQYKSEKNCPRKKKTRKKKPKRDSSNDDTVIPNANVKNNLLTFGSLGSALATGNGTTLIEFTSEDPLAIDYEIFLNHKFPFENIVLEGGGIKGLAYAGALMVSLKNILIY